jgi:PAS domain S-box-containing protein
MKGTALETDRFMQTVLDQMPEGVMVVAEPDGRIVFANAAAGRIIGQPLQPGRSLAELDATVRFLRASGEPFPLEDLPLRRSLEEGVLVHGQEFMIERPDGTRAAVLASSAPIATVSGEDRRAVAVFQDISERLQQEHALREVVARLEQARERQRTLGEITRAISASLNLEQVLEMIRRAVIEALGFDRAGIFLVDEERAVIRGVCGTDRAGNREDISWDEMPLTTDTDGPMERIYRQEIDYFLTEDWDRDGRWPPGHPSHGVRAHALIPFRAGNRVVGIVAVDNLVTQRPIGQEEVEELFLFADAAAVAIQNARLYAAAARHTSDLEAIVEARTAELRQTQEQLLSSERLVAIGSFAGRVAHDLRNPLNVLQLNLQLLRSRASSDPALSRPLERVEQAMNQAAALVTDLVDFARLGSPRPAPMRIEPLLRRLVEERTPPDGVQILLEIEPELPSIAADMEQIHRLLVNLVTNALQAMNRAGTVTLAARREGDRIALVVRDEGTGIAAETLPRIFEPLFSTRHRGNGLGLAVSRKIVESHAGEIHVDSCPGIGSTFTVLLPLAPPPAPASLSAGASAGGTTPTAPPQ